MSRRKLFGLVGSVALAVSLVAGTFVVTASAAPDAFPAQYAAKFVCGFVVSDVEFGAKPGNYATAINVGNTSRANVAGQYRVMLHYRPGGALPPVIPTQGLVVARYRTAEVDCPAIWTIVGVPPHTYLKGFVHIGLDSPLPVTAVYTAQTTHDPQLPPNAGAGISIDVDTIHMLPIPG